MRARYDRPTRQEKARHQLMRDRTGRKPKPGPCDHGCPPDVACWQCGVEMFGRIMREWGGSSSQAPRYKESQ